MKGILEWALAFVLSLIVHGIFKVDQGKVFFVAYITSGTILILAYVYCKSFKKKELSGKEVADVIVVFILGTIFSVCIVYVASRFLFKIDFYTAYQIISMGYAIRSLREKNPEGGSQS